MMNDALNILTVKWRLFLDEYRKTYIYNLPSLYLKAVSVNLFS